MPEKHRQTYTIKETECDNQYNIRLAALWDLMQDAADQHAGLLGHAHEQMQANGNFFALIRMKLNIIEYPKARETIAVETYPDGVDKLFCVRLYNVYNEKGEKIAEAISYWIIVDIETGRPLRPLIAYPNQTMFKYAYKGETPTKIPTAENSEFIKEITAEFCDIDGNNHVNNSRYINWLENIHRVDNPPIKSLNVNYVAETTLGETLATHKSKNIYSFQDKEHNLRFTAEILK